jgi:hypothetical protein
MSNSKSHKSLVREQLARAKSKGMHHPVVACLWHDSPHAKAIYQERHGHLIGGDQQDETDDGTVLETWDAQEAPCLLRRHAGIGGAAVANLVEALAEAVSWWYMDFQRPSLTVKGFEEPFPVSGWGRALFDNTVFYDKLPNTVCRRCRKKMKDGGAVHCHLHDGHTTVVCGASLKEMTASIELVSVAETGCLPSLCLGMRTGRLKLQDEDLALILHRLYEDQPRVVAEAIRALRKLPGERDAWLVKVLNGSPSLDKLAADVRRELEGE